MATDDIHYVFDPIHLSLEYTSYIPHPYSPSKTFEVWIWILYSRSDMHISSLERTPEFRPSLNMQCNSMVIYIRFVAHAPICVSSNTSKCRVYHCVNMGTNAVFAIWIRNMSCLWDIAGRTTARKETRDIQDEAAGRFPESAGELNHQEEGCRVEGSHVRLIDWVEFIIPSTGYW